MPNTVDDLKKSIIDAVEARAKDFLSENSDAKTFLYDRAQRLAKLGYDYALETDDAKKQTITDDMKIVKQSMENEIAAVAVNAAVASRDLFKAVLGTAMDTLIKALPVILAAV
jgi:hypothetical protein